MGPQSQSGHFGVGNLTCWELVASHEGPRRAPQS